MPRGVPNKKEKPSTRRPNRLTHASLNRPGGLFMEKLPQGAQVMMSRTPWQVVCDMLVKDWGTGNWLALEQVYTSPNNAAASARKTLEGGHGYPPDAAKSLEVAFREVRDEAFEVFLRLNPATEPLVRKVKDEVFDNDDDEGEVEGEDQTPW